ncbi:MAG: DUF748 domain-containing protein, partial [Desulfocapsaceae bacterium]|nr:DUF748 domain-containing protein [Desulfocapsaceae bacterium]
GSLKTKGSLHIAPFLVSSEIAFSQLSPLELFSWFSTSKTFRQSQAHLSGQGTFRYPQKEYKGSLSAENVIIGDSKNPLFRAAAARFDELSWAEQAQLLSIHYILVENPEFSWLRTDSETNPATPLSDFLSLLFLPEPGPGGEDADKPVGGFSLDINQIDFNNGTITYRDDRILPPLTLDLTAINGNLNKLEYPRRNGSGNFKLAGNMDGHPFNLEGSGNLIQDQPGAQVTFNAQALPLSLFSEQVSQKINGLNPLKGSVTVQAVTEFGSGGIKQSARIICANFLPQSSGSGAALALSLLTEAGDSFILDVETEGDPKAAIVTEALGTLGTSVIKVSINPMLLAGEEFKDLINTQYIPFSPGSSQLSGESVERLNRFSEFLSAHPLIKMKITGYVDRVEDYTAIYNNLVELERNQTEQKNKLLKEEWEKKKQAEDTAIEQQLAAQNGEIKETDIPTNRIADFVPVAPRQVEVSETMLQILAMEREKNIMSFLINNLAVSPAQLEHTDPDLNRIKNDESYSRADISFSDLYSEIILKEI